MKISFPALLLLVSALFVSIHERCEAFALEGGTWPSQSKVVMHLGLGATSVALQDGSASWDASATDALALWNEYLDFIHISAVSSPIVPQTSGDRINSVFFSNSAFGESFGEDTLAVTVLLTKPTPKSASITEADVVVNSAFRFNSYRGPQQSDSLGPIYDFHRVVLHEFGHVLGLAHSTKPPMGTAIMEAIISDFDHLGPDDIAGIRSLYGAQFTGLPNSVKLRVQYYFQDSVKPNVDFDLIHANNNPSSFSATGLPPGLTFDSSTGMITGIPTKSGVYNSVITAHGPVANAYGAYQFTVLGLEEVPGLLAIIPQSVTAMVADPIRPRIYIGSYDGIAMIDTNTFAVTSLKNGDASDALLSVSADGSKLLYTFRYASPAQEFRIDLDSLTSLPTLSIPADYTPVIEGLNKQSYVAANSYIYQFDSTTGVVQQYFTAPQMAPVSQLAISHDLRTLYVSTLTATATVSSYDVSTPIPQPIRKLAGSYASMAPSPDGRFLYLTTVGEGTSLLQAHLPNLTPAPSLATATGYLTNPSIAPDGSIYESVPAADDQRTRSGYISVYNPVTLRKSYDIQLSGLQANLDPYSALAPVFDYDGKTFFSRMEGNQGEIWAFSVAGASAPPPAQPTKNLLNISTRARVENGEAAMVGGFIVQGTQPKKVLIRGLGPSLPVSGAIADPVLELYDSTGKLIAKNDNWPTSELDIVATQLAPLSPKESAIAITLAPGAYTAVVHDLHDLPGPALVEVYDLDQKDSLLANISTRGEVETGDNVMIGGFIVGGASSTSVLVRALGPSLSRSGVTHPLVDPILEIHDSTGKLIAINDDWRSAQASTIEATGIAPTDSHESAVLLTLPPGSYTAIVRGKSNATGVALIEVYNLDSSSSAH